MQGIIIVAFQLKQNLVHACTKLSQFNAIIVFLPWVGGTDCNHFLEIHRVVLFCICLYSQEVGYNYYIILQLSALIKIQQV